MQAASPRDFDEAQAAPHFATGKRAVAKAAYDRHDFGAALKLLEAEGDENPVRYLRALCLLGLGAWEKAALELDELAVVYEPLTHTCRLQAGQAYERLGRYRDAAERYASVAPAARVHPQAQLALAQVLARAGLRQEALATVEVLNASTEEPRAEQLWAQVELARAAGAKDNERRTLLALWSRWPQHPLAATARAALGANLPLEAKVAHAESLLALHKNRAALAEVERLSLPALPDPLSCRGQLVAGHALRKEREHSKAIARLLPVVERCPPSDTLARAMFVLGYSQSVLAPPDAVETFLRLSARMPEHPLADDALRMAAEAEVRLGHPEAALALHEQLLRRRWTDALGAEASFQSFWVLRGQGRSTEALARLDALESMAALGLYAPADGALLRSRYWRGRTLESLGRVREAIAAYMALLDARPAGYYPALARTRLRALAVSPPSSAAVPPLDAPLSWPQPAGTLWSDPRFVTGVELLRLSLPGAASELLSIDRSRLSVDSVRLLYQLFAERQMESPSRLLARELLLRGDVHSRGVWELTYQRPFRSIIESHSASAGVDADLMQALIRTESGFDPSARSPAGAIGLAQLMPATARAVARSLKLPSPGPWALRQPATNVRLGAAYLATLLDQFGGERVFSVASYNAGPNAVGRWRRERGELPLDEFVETIPTLETRDYVKRVLDSQDVYAQLWSSEEPAPTSVVAWLNP